MTEGGGKSRLRLGGAERVWLLNGVLVAAALVLHLLVVRRLAPVDTSLRLPWWALSALFVVCETCVVHLHFRRDAHSFTLADIPLVLGLFFAMPGDLVIARVIGSLIALGIIARQRSLKLIFNLALFWLETCIAVVLFGAVIDNAHPFGVSGWVATIPTLVFISFLGVAMIFLAISISEGRLQREGFAETAGLAMGVTAADTCLALVAALSLAANPGWSWLLGVPATVLFLAYRGYSSTRRKQESIEFLYDATRMINDSKQVESAIVSLLEHTRRTFRSEIAEVSFYPSSADGRVLRTTLGPGDAVEVMKPIDVDPREALAMRATNEGRAMLITRPAQSRPQAEADDGIKDAMVAPLYGETRAIGTMLVANHLGDVSSYDVEDLKLFETLASHVSVALENGRLEQTLAQLTQLKEEFEHLALHDTLTNLANRALFNDRVEHAVARGLRHQVPMAVVFLDIDDFKVVNDSLGHAAGDQLLKGVAERVGESLRPSDTAARLGGDEFALLLEDIVAIEDATMVAERIIEKMRKPFSIDGKDVFVQASLGIAYSATGTEKADDMLRHADLAMYRAKARGKGCFEVFQAGMHTEAVARLELVADLRRAVERKEFTVFYQPIVSLQSERVIGAEALVRWLHPERGLLSPGEFIQIAEETGQVLAIGRMVLEQACRQAATWGSGPDAPRLSVNLSTRQLQDRRLVDDVRSILGESGLEPERLILELTESGLMQDTTVTHEMLHELKSTGVRIAIDDFGIGYSSLSYLRRFPIDILKIDRTFVDAIGESPEDSTLARAIVTLGASLGLDVVAEGVERADQMAWLRDLGCEMGQGFFFSRPIAAEGMSSYVDGDRIGAVDNVVRFPRAAGSF